ncbi:MAG: GNAT family N-acetyltransferase [Actinomycetota bacterium]|nr:GNAT family N-acetyltransferase [Actinomycetota bacterium]
MQEPHRTEIVVAVASPEQHERLGEITVEAYRSAGQLGGSEASYAIELADVAGRAAHADILVATDGDGRVVGGATYVPGPGTPSSEFADADAAGIRMLAVDPAAGRRGVGRALTIACVDRARAAGRRRVVLHTVDGNAPARRMYEALGFQRDPGADWEPVPGLVLVGYRLELPTPGTVPDQQASTNASRS